MERRFHNFKYITTPRPDKKKLVVIILQSFKVHFEFGINSSSDVSRKNGKIF